MAFIRTDWQLWQIDPISVGQKLILLLVSSSRTKEAEVTTPSLIKGHFGNSMQDAQEDILGGLGRNDMGMGCGPILGPILEVFGHKNLRLRMHV
mmetsp:Transcript_26214/g.53719  ORF Transcript_26214/g.53719 Transcript_26214/m.53719 type:complete len:94 (-) Transcript_26214:86-367(-)